MREHEYMPPDDRGRQWCKYYGTLFHVAMTSTCIDRPNPHGPPPRPWRGSALDDNDAMAARLAELRRERDAELAAPSEHAAADELDISCGWRLP